MSEIYSEERRKLLKTLVILGGGVASLSTGKKVNAASLPSPAAPDVPPKTYAETDHIRKYYQTARS